MLPAYFPPVVSNFKSTMPVNQHAQEVMAAFQRFVKTNNSEEVGKYSRTELVSADEALGANDLSAPFRIALRNRINDIDGHNEKKYQSKVRALGYVVTFAAGALAAVVAERILR